MTTCGLFLAGVQQEVGHRRPCSFHVVTRELSSPFFSNPSSFRPSFPHSAGGAILVSLLRVETGKVMRRTLGGGGGGQSSPFIKRPLGHDTSDCMGQQQVLYYRGASKNDVRIGGGNGHVKADLVWEAE